MIRKWESRFVGAMFRGEAGQSTQWQQGRSKTEEAEVDRENKNV